MDGGYWRLSVVRTILVLKSFPTFIQQGGIVNHGLITRIVAIRKLMLSTRLSFRSEVNQGICLYCVSPVPRAPHVHRKHSPTVD
jgi:hypothetical protein